MVRTFWVRGQLLSPSHRKALKGFLRPFRANYGAKYRYSLLFPGSVPTGRWVPSAIYFTSRKYSYLAEANPHGLLSACVQRLLQHLARPELRFSPRRDVDDLPRLGIPRRRFGLGAFDGEGAESPDLDALAVAEHLAHRLEQAVDHVEGR